MLFSTPLQLLVLCAVAVFAWLLGFIANPTAFNRGNMVRRLAREFTDFRAQSQGRMNNLTRHAATLEEQQNTLTARLSDAEARLAAHAVAPAPVAVPEVAEAAPIAEHIAPTVLESDVVEPVADDAFVAHASSDPAPIGAPTVPEPTEGWLGSGARDALTRIDGIDADLDQRLFDLGITRFEDIEKLSDQDEMALELRLALPAGYITSRQWRTQAAQLRAGDPDEFTTRFGTPPIAGV